MTCKKMIHYYYYFYFFLVHTYICMHLFVKKV